MRNEVLSVAKKPENKPKFTSFRLFVQDAEDLSELADKRGMSVAQLYRAMFSEIVRKELVAESEKRLRELKDRRPS